MIHKNNQNIRYVAIISIKVNGLVTSSLTGVKYGAAHCKYLEKELKNAPKISKRCFVAIMVLFPQSITGAQWWYSKINCSKYNITKGETAIEISSDASSSR